MNEIARHFQLPFTPAARAEAVISGPQVRFTVLTSRLIRLEYAPDGVFEDRPSQAFWHRDQPAPDFTTTQDGDSIEIETEHLHLHYRVSDQGFQADTLSITLKAGGITWHYGDADPLNLKGTYRTLDQAGGYVPLEPGLMSRAGWAVVDDSRALVFDDQCWLEPRGTHPAAQDLYFFGYGHDYRDCLRDFNRIAGATPLIPRWILGNWWSRYWRYSEADLLALMDDFKAHEVPLAVCIVDMDWHITETGNTSTGWTGYTWNRTLFPAPDRFIAALHARGLRTALNLHPAEGVYPHEAMYPQMAERLGIDPASQKPVPFDIASPAFTEAYFDLLHHPEEARGVDFWWLDWQQGQKTKVSGLDPLWWLNHLHFYDLGRDGTHRPFIFSRWGGLGNHRYPIGFSGDTFVTWEALAFQPYFTATAANVGYGWWSHDIGGHYSGREDPELYTRWVQFGVFSPIFRLHSSNGEFYDRRPWGQDSADVFHAARDAMQLRHALIPYLYTMAWRNAAESLPPVQPMYYAYPEAEEAYVCPQQYLFGSELIAAPFTAPADPDTRLARQVVWLPEGDWFHFFTGERYASGWHAIYGRLADIPVFARAGAIIPLGPKVGWGGIENPAELDVHVFAGADGHFTLYEDDGTTNAYRRGEFSLTEFTQSWEKNRLVMSIAAAAGDARHLPAQRTIRLHLHGVVSPETIRLQIDGADQPCPAKYDAESDTLHLAPVAVPVATALHLELSVQAGSLLAQHDRTHDKLIDMARAFHLDSGPKHKLARQMSELQAHPERLAEFARVLADSQKRALFETICGAGIHHVRDTAQADLVVLWNNHARPEITYLLVPPDRRAHYHLGVKPVTEQGIVPGFKAFVPTGRLVKSGYWQETANCATWQVTASYFNHFDVTYKH